MKINAFSRTSRHITAGLCAAGLAASIATAPAASAREESKDDVLTTFETVVVQGLAGFDTRTGKTLDLSPLKVVNNLVDATTGEILGKGTTRFAVSADGPTDDVRSCIKSSNRKGLTAYNPTSRYLTSDKGTIQFFQFLHGRARVRRRQRVVAGQLHRALVWMLAQQRQRGLPGRDRPGPLGVPPGQGAARG